jgi:cytidylate kinase
MPTEAMVIAIDGPAGSGKSTVTKRIAKRLGILYLDTGAMYRAAALGFLEAGIDQEDPAAIAAWVRARDIGFDADGGVTLDGRALGDAIRSPAITAETWRVANNAGCRDHLVALQRAIVAGRDAALEGRDTTSVICPDAPLKIYLEASPEERARRRLEQWAAEGEAPSYEQVLADIRLRDDRDTNREVGALTKVSDAVHIVTDGFESDETEACVIAHAVRRRPMLLEATLGDQLLVGRNRQPGYVKVAQGSIMDPPAPWQLGLTNPSPDRLPETTRAFSCNSGGRQAGVLCQGRAVICLAGTGAQPGRIVALPMLPQSWYVIEPGVWHAVVQLPGTIAAWAESSVIREQRAELDELQRKVLARYLDIYLPER